MMKDEILRYLGYKDSNCEVELSYLIDECIKEIETISNFSYVYVKDSFFYSFLNKEDYKKLLEGCSSYILCAATLGYDVDKKIKYYQVSNPLKALVMDAAASAYLIDKADKYEAVFGGDRTFRFCPGYGETPLSDNKEILGILSKLHPLVTVLDSLMLSPNKSMVGIIGLGVKKNKNCNSCMFKSRCVYRKEDSVCLTK